jgi:hypothetical protein
MDLLVVYTSCKQTKPNWCISRLSAVNTRVWLPIARCGVDLLRNTQRWTHRQHHRIARNTPISRPSYNANRAKAICARMNHNRTIIPPSCSYTSLPYDIRVIVRSELGSGQLLAPKFDSPGLYWS